MAALVALLALELPWSEAACAVAQSTLAPYAWAHAPHKLRTPSSGPSLQVVSAEPAATIGFFPRRARASTRGSMPRMAAEEPELMTNTRVSATRERLLSDLEAYEA